MIRYSFFGYALASAIILIICGMAYQFFFSQKVRPNVNRIALLTILLLGLTAPLLALPFIPNGQPQDMNISIGNPVVANVIFEKAPTSSFSSLISMILPILNYMYLGGIIIMTVVTLVSTIRLILITIRSTKTTEFGVKVYRHDNALLSSFSWLNLIFLYNGAKKEDIRSLLLHEMAHVRLYHYADIIIMQIVLILQWFNPAVWMMKRELQEVHEYQADTKVIQTGTDKYNYQHLLLRNISNTRLPGLVAGIRGRSIKKRFLMMQKKDFKSNLLVRSLTISLAVIFGMILLQMPAVAEIVEEKEPISKENMVVVENTEGGNVVYHIDNREVTYEEARDFDSSKISCVEVFKGETKVVGIVTNEYDSINNVSGRRTPSSSQFIPLSGYEKNAIPHIDRIPAYQGGKQRLQEELYYLLEYQSFPRNVHGTVEVGFTVNKEGYLENFHILQSLGSEFDIAAVMAIRSLKGRWLPGIVDGEPAAIEMKIPVSFSI